MKKQEKRNGLTLVELLVVMSLIMTVSSMFLVAYRGASLEAHRARTGGTIRKISEILNARMQEYESFPVSPMMIDTSIAPSAPSFEYHLVQIPPDAFPIPYMNAADAEKQETTTKLVERARLMHLRQLIRLEMPDHPDDLKWTTSWLGGTPPVAHVAAWTSTNYPLVTGLVSPTLGTVFTAIPPSRRAMRLISKLSSITASGMVPKVGWETTFANAELLYLIVEDSDFNGSSAIELFGKSEIGDVDGDGLNEFLDSYGNPIQWVRWPTGSAAITRYHPDLLDPNLNPSTIASDPFDRLRTDPAYIPPIVAAAMPAGGLMPLVVASGPDKVTGYRLQLDSPIAPGSSRSVGDVTMSFPYPPGTYTSVVTDPWYPRTTPILRNGAVVSSIFAEDDITNFDVLSGGL